MVDNCSAKHTVHNSALPHTTAGMETKQLNWCNKMSTQKNTHRQQSAYVYEAIYDCKHVNLSFPSFNFSLLPTILSINLHYVFFLTQLSFLSCAMFTSRRRLTSRNVLCQMYCHDDILGCPVHLSGNHDQWLVVSGWCSQCLVVETNTNKPIFITFPRISDEGGYRLIVTGKTL